MSESGVCTFSAWRMKTLSMAGPGRVGSPGKGVEGGGAALGEPSRTEPRL